MSSVIAPVAALRAALDGLAELVESIGFDLPTPEQADRRKRRDRLVWTIHEYLLARLGDLEAPVVAVVVGSTGSGKSTLVNSLAQARISEPGVLRPTTRAPVVWCHTSHADRYREGFLEGFGEAPEATHPMEVVATEHEQLRHLTVIDAPDFDSVYEDHRTMTEQLLAVADLCVFVTSAQRYADAVPWEFLDAARRRDLPLIFVMNRLSDRSAITTADYSRLLAGRGLKDEIITIEEQSVSPEHGGLPPPAVDELTGRLALLADPAERRRVVTRATRGAVREAVAEARRLAADCADTAAVAEHLADLARRPYEEQVEALGKALFDGNLIRQEVLARWQDFIGAGELLKAVGEGAGRVREWVRRVFGGRPVTREIGVQAGDELAATVARRADAAAQAAASAWEAHPTGRLLLAGVREGKLWRHDRATGELAESSFADWMAEITDMIRQEGEGKRRWAQAASYGVNAVAVVLLVTVFLQTGGLTGAEVGVAAGAAAAQQKILEHVFGSAAARSLIERARRQLAGRMAVVVRRDGARFEQLLTSVRPVEGSCERLEAGAELVADRAEEFYGA